MQKYASKLPFQIVQLLVFQRRFAQVFKHIQMNFNFKEIATASMVLFAVIDILGSIPIIISLREKVGHIQSEKASIVATSIMIAFLFVGERILNLIGIDVNSFAVAGAFIIFFLALEMILGITLFKDDEPETASIVPIAFPIVAGAGTLTSILSLRAEYHVENIIVAIIINSIFVYLVLKSSKRIGKALGKGGLSVIRKVFGMILLAIAVKLFATNIDQLLQ
jgi:multiple antibiotic resistance protein